MGWAEIFRRDIQFLDVGENARNEQAMLLLSRIGHTLSYGNPAAAFHIFRINQRAVGELMIPAESRPGERWCIGYADFCRRMAEDETFRDWLEELTSHVDVAAREPGATSKRATRLQHQLIDLIDFLDPERTRFPADVRTRFDQPEIERQLAAGT